MNRYIIIGSPDYMQLTIDVNKFLEISPEYKLLGGPYSSGTSHYQAVIREEKQLLKN